MNINHLNLPVPDVKALHDFMIAHFGFRSNTANPAKFSVLGKGEFILVLMHSTEPMPKDFHIGFFVDDALEVRQKHAELTEAGINVGELQEIKRGEYSSLTFYCQAPGVLIEVTAGL